MSIAVNHNDRGFVGRARAILASPWVAAALVLSMIAALRLIAPWSDWLDNLKQAQPLWLGVGALLVLPHTALKVLRMEQLIPDLKSFRGPHLRLSYAMACVAQLPTGSIGGDAYRIVKFGCLGVCEKQSTSATVILRLAGFATTLLVGGALGAWYLGSLLPLLAVGVALAILFLLGTSAHPPGLIERLKTDVIPGDTADMGKIARLFRGLRIFLTRTLEQARDLPRARLTNLVLITGGLIALRGLALWACAKAVGLEIGPPGAAFALCAGNLMSSIPSPAGSVGLREGGIVGAFAVLGAAAAPATIASVLFRLVLIAGAMLGWAIGFVLWKSPDQIFESRTLTSSPAPREPA